MEYTIQKLAKLSGVSTRTLRYYHQIGLLEPARINSSGYRIYGEKEVDRLQQILFFKELGFSLAKIKSVITAKDFHRLAALKQHHKSLLAKKEQLALLLTTVEKSIAALEGGEKMDDKEKFEGFKKDLIATNEERFGEEIREKYGKEAVDGANAKLMGLTKEEFQEMKALGSELFEVLAAAFKTGDPAGELAQKAAALHKRWLLFTWPKYNKEAHANLAQMYVADPRFTAYYDKERPGTAKFLRDAILIYTQK